MPDLRHRKSGNLIGRTALATVVLFISQWFGWCGRELSAASPGLTAPGTPVAGYTLVGRLGEALSWTRTP